MKITNLEMESLKYAQYDLNNLVATLDVFKNERDLNDKPLNHTESNTCSKVILPFLHIFGWKENGPNQWSSQHRIEGSRRHVDYAFSRNHGWVYLEAKSIDEKNLSKKKFLNQIAGYFNDAPNAHLIILTNGEEYRFYSYGEHMGISTTPFIKFNIHNLDLTGKGSFMRHFFRNYFNIGDWPKYADMSRSLSDIQHALRKAPDTLGKQHLINRSFELIYPNMDEDERNEAIQFFSTYK